MRSNFAVPEHDGTLEIGGAVEHPLTLTLDDLRALPAVERAVTLECAGNGRLEMRPLPTGEPWGDYAVSTAALERAPCCTRSSPKRPRRRRRRGPLRRRRPRDLPPDTRCSRTPTDRPALRALAAARATRRPGRRDPDRLRDERRAARPDHGAPFRLDRAALVRRRLGQVAEAHRRAHRAVHRRVPDRALHVRVARPPAEPVTHHARPRTDHRSRARSPCSPPAAAHRPRQGVVRHRPGHRRSRSASPASRRLAARPSSSRPRAPTSGRTGRSTGTPTALGRHTLRARATDAAGNVQPEVPPWNRLGYGNNAVEVPYVDVT